VNWRSGAAHLLREPIVHFILAGAVVFALMSGRAPDVGERRIVVNEAVVARLGQRWTENFRRQPSPQELDGLINEYVRDQVYYREALRLGLDKDDEVVMRRMRNKMIAIATSDAEAASPSDADLQKLIDADPARYAAEVTYSFDQLYLGADNPADRQNAAAALASSPAIRHSNMPSRCRSRPASGRPRRAMWRRNSAANSAMPCAACRRASGPGRSCPGWACIWSV
jgi:hypothetical protein